MEEDGRPRPIPVREFLAQQAEEAAEAERAEAADPPDRAGDALASPEPPRTVSVDGILWTATALGATRTGQAVDAGALLLLVRFDSGKEGGDAGGADAREGLAVARSLDDVDDDALLQLWERSRIVLK